MPLFRRTEPPALALEVRVLWGGDVLRVEHLTPPRTWAGGDLDPDLGPASLPLVVVERGRVFVRVPSGAAVAIQSRDRRDAITDAERIELVPGELVTIALPSRLMAAYRAAPASADAARIAIEVSLVPAERAFGRASFEVTASVAASAAITAGLVAAASAGTVLLAPMCAPECDEAPSPERVLMLQSLLDREAVDLPQMERPDGPKSDFPRPPRPMYPPWSAERAFGDHPFEDPPELAFMPAADLCELGGFSLRPAEFAVAHMMDFDHPLYTVCRNPLLTPFGMRGLDRPGEDPFDLGASQVWRLQYAEALKHLPRHDTACGFGARRRPTVTWRLSVTVASRTAPRWISADRLDRVLRSRHAELLACYEIGLHEDPNLQEAVEMNLVIGADGVSSVRPVAPSGTRVGLTGRVERCVMGALAGLRVPSPEGRADTVRVDVRLGLVEVSLP